MTTQHSHMVDVEGREIRVVEEWREAGRCTACGLKGCYGARGPWCPYMRRHTSTGPVPAAYAHQVVPWPASARLAAAIRNGDDLRCPDLQLLQEDDRG